MQQEKLKKIYKNPSFWRFIIFGVIVIYIIVSIFVYGRLVHELPKLSTDIMISTDQLYHELKDFDQNNTTITSTSADPSIMVNLEKEVSVKSLKIRITSLSTDQTNSQIYYASNGEEFSEDKYVEFIMKNGENIINFPEGISAKNLRLDLTDVKGVSFNIESIDVKFNQNNIILAWVILLLMEVLYCGIVTLVYFYNEENKWNYKIGRKDLKSLIINSVVIFAFCYVFVALYSYKFIPLPNLSENNLERKFLSNDIRNNLNEFILENNTLTSTGEDPQIHIKFNEDINKRYLEITLNDLKDNKISIDSIEAKVYYAKDSKFTENQSVKFQLKNGLNIIKIDSKDRIDSLRLDLASFPNISFEIKEIKVANTFAQYIPFLIKVFLFYFIFMFLVIINRYNIVKMKDIIKKIDETVDGAFTPFKRFCNEFGRFIEENKKAVVIIGIITVACFGLLITYYTVYIDEEAALMANNTFVNWVGQGRFGNYLIDKYLLVNHKFTPFIGDFIASILITISSLIMCFNISSLKEKIKPNKIAIVAFCSFYMSMPFTVGGYMIVGSYNVEMGIALCCVSLATYLSIVCKTMRKFDYIWSVVLLGFAISIYQAYIAFFITIVTIYAFIYVLYNKESNNIRKVANIIIKNAIICICATVLYYIGNKIFTNFIMQSSNYLQDNFIGWGKGKSILQVLHTVIMNIYYIYRGSSTILYGGIVINISVAVFIVFLAYQIITMKKNKGLLIFLSASMFIAPFAVIIAIGSPIMAGRTLLGLNLFIASIWFILIEFSNKFKINKMIIVTIASILIFLQIQYLNKFFYADYNRYRMDVNLTNLIMSDIREVNNNNLQMPVVFVGTYNYPNSGMMANYDLIINYELAGSYFSVDGGSNIRIVHFIQTLGYPLTMPTSIQISDSQNYISDMESWPSKKSVKVVNGYVIVKLS